MSRANGKDPRTVQMNISRIRQLHHQEWSEKEHIRLDNQRVRQSRTPAQQLQALDWRLGKDVGANRERKRLHSMLHS